LKRPRVNEVRTATITSFEDGFIEAKIKIAYSEPNLTLTLNAPIGTEITFGKNIIENFQLIPHSSGCKYSGRN